MNVKRIISPPGWSARWIIGTALLGLVLPTVVAAIVVLAGYYPIGQGVPDSPFWSDTGVIAVVFCAGTLVLLAAPIYSLLAWSWRPVALALILEIMGIAGIIPGIISAQYLRLWAFEVFTRRSETLVNAIEKYLHATGIPPATLEVLVPDYLPSIPGTGMAADVAYRYAANAGECSDKSRWHLLVSVQQFIDMNRLLHCPSQDYDPADYPIMSRTRIGTWVYDEVAF